MSMTNLQNFGHTIRKIRKEKKLTQENIAFELGISQEAYGKLENGKTKLNIDHLEGLSKVFEMDLMEMLLYDSEKYHIKEVKDKATGVNNGTIEHTGLDVKQQELYLKQIEQLLAHNQQLIAENQQLRQALGGV